MSEEKKPLLEEKNESSNDGRKYGAIGQLVSKSKSAIERGLLSTSLIQYMLIFLPVKIRAVFARANIRIYQAYSQMPLLIDLNALKTRLAKKLVWSVFPETLTELREGESAKRVHLEQLAENLFNEEDTQTHDAKFIEALSPAENQSDDKESPQVNLLIDQVRQEYKQNRLKNFTIVDEACMNPYLAYRLINNVDEKRLPESQKIDRFSPSLYSKFVGACMGLGVVSFYGFAFTLISLVITMMLFSFMKELQLPFLTLWAISWAAIAFAGFLYAMMCHSYPRVPLYKIFIHVISTPIYFCISAGQFVKAGWMLGRNVRNGFDYCYDDIPRPSLQQGFERLLSTLKGQLTIKELARECPVHHKRLLGFNSNQVPITHAAQLTDRGDNLNTYTSLGEKVLPEDVSDSAQTNSQPSTTHNGNSFFHLADTPILPIAFLGEGVLKPGH